MNELTLMIIDSSDAFREALAAELRQDFVIYHCRNGKEALIAAPQIKPQIMVLDLMLTEMDGISLLYELQDLGLRPMVLATTILINDYVTDAAQKLGLCYLIRKPCSIKAAANRVRDLAKQFRSRPHAISNPAERAHQWLRMLGFSPKHRGTDYLAQAILIAAQKPGIAITKELYPTIGSRNQSTSAQVERSIRTAISAAWEQSAPSWLELLPPNPGKQAERPSNGLLIARLAEELRRELPPEDEQAPSLVAKQMG